MILIKVSLILMSSLKISVLSAFNSSTVSQLTSHNIGKLSPHHSLSSSWGTHNKKLISEIMKSYYWLQLKLQLQMLGTCVDVLPLTIHKWKTICFTAGGRTSTISYLIVLLSNQTYQHQVLKWWSLIFIIEHSNPNIILIITQFQIFGSEQSTFRWTGKTVDHGTFFGGREGCTS